MQFKSVATHTDSERVSTCLLIPVNWEVESKENEKGFYFWTDSITYKEQVSLLYLKKKSKHFNAL